MKTIIALLCIMLSSTSFAMRCGNNLIMEHDSVLEVLQACGEPESRTGDFLYYRINSMYYTLRIVNDVVTRIDEDRSI